MLPKTVPLTEAARAGLRAANAVLIQSIVADTDRAARADLHAQLVENCALLGLLPPALAAFGTVPADRRP
ncbi:hypothetical protein [Sphingomonas profundi]|uniref:hypothetical protein n=1 Tax=Alterirhizorhabdus profundi TaxID=2681549 RepID=UPI0012E963F4|nr:hypothetical protein [Sphingomonas profundi]